MLKVSEYYEIDSGELEKRDIFDSIIGTDNPYFMDPSMLPYTEVPEFENAQEELLEHFKKVFALIKVGKLRFKVQAIRMLMQPDLKGASTGYGESDDGAGVGLKLARKLVEVAEELLSAGNDDPIIFEIMGLFTPEFGPDRMGDLVNGILKKSIYRFTARIAEEFKIKTNFIVKCDGEVFKLPRHPLSDKKPILFFPASLLSPLPIVLSWEDMYAAAVFNDEVREKFNKFLQPLFTATPKPSKEEIWKYVKEEDSKDRMDSLVEVYKTTEPHEYDFKKDPAGNYRWYEDAKEIFKELKKPEIDEVKTLEELKATVDFVITYYKKGIENYMWKHSYEADGTPKNETYFQNLFQMIAEPICKGKNIDVSRESNKGRGPVDFKLSRGNANVSVEMKLTSNTHLTQGFKVQLPIYVKAEESQYAYYVVIRTTETSTQLDAIEALVKETKEDKVAIKVISAIPKESASKAKTVS